MSQLGNLSPYMIAGGLNFGSVPGQNDYQSAYKNALSLNQQNYSNILAGYQGLGQRQQAAQNQIQQGYGALSSQVMNDIQGIDASQRQSIQDTYAQQAGGASQGLISRGLGNTTVANTVQRGLSFDRAKADIALSNQTAQLTAGYRSNLGMAGLNYANQANMQNTALGSQQLGFMNSVNAPYPNSAQYANARLQQQTLALARQGAGGGRSMMMGGGGTNFGKGGGFGGVGSFNPQAEQGSAAYNNGGGPGRSGGGPGRGGAGGTQPDSGMGVDLYGGGIDQYGNPLGGGGGGGSDGYDSSMFGDGGASNPDASSNLDAYNSWNQQQQDLPPEQQQQQQIDPNSYDSSMFGDGGGGE